MAFVVNVKFVPILDKLCGVSAFCSAFWRMDDIG